MNNSYNQLLNLYKDIVLLESIRGLLYWDLNTGMPEKGLNFRTQQFSWVNQALHKRWTANKLYDLIKKCEKISSLGKIELRNIELMHRDYANRTIIPADLVGELAVQSNKTLEVWKKAKKKDQFNIVLPDLKELFNLNLKRSELLANAKDINDPYEALIDTRDPGFSINILSQLFNEAKSFLVPFVKKCTNSSIQPDLDFLDHKVSRETQIKLLHDLAKYLEYDLSVGRIDEVEHPLSIQCGPQDIRVTVKYNENRIMKAVSAGIHEIGHALTGLQRNPEWLYQPINHITYPAFGESQSRLLQNMIGYSQEFWISYYNRFQNHTEGVFKEVELDDFYFAINHVSPGLTRMEADEVTYCLHIIIRFEIERDLFAGNIEPDIDLPQIWNEKYEEYLGVDVPSNTLGIMQDLHWFSQYWGYFYGYGIGDMIAAQITTAGLTLDLPEWRQQLKNGKFTPIRGWLAKNVHSKGAILDTLDLVEEITGKPLSYNYLKDYLDQKYSLLYQI
ncbi:MAG: carboxypeptidase M32 [Candidatus Hermodarchaeota archaeon]